MELYEQMIYATLGLSFFTLFVHTNIKGFKNSTGSKSVPLLFLICLPIYLALVPAAVAGLIFFACLRQLVKLFLAIKLGNKFLGLAEKADAVHCVEGGSKSVINILFVCEYDEDRYGQSFFNTCHDETQSFIFKDPNRFPKFLAQYGKLFGYTYMMKDRATVDDVLRQMNTVDCPAGELERSDLTKILTEHANQPLPKNETILWEACVGTQPLNWNRHVQKKGAKAYPLLVRVHHGMCDGVSLIKLLIGAWADNNKINVVSPEAWLEEVKAAQAQLKATRAEKEEISFDQAVSSKEMLMNAALEVLGVLKTVAISAYMLFIAPATIYAQSLVKAKDENSLHGPELSGEVILGMAAEKGHGYVDKVRQIKDKFPGSSFPEILLTAFAASLEDCFAKRTSACPEYVSAVIPVLSGAADLKQIVPGETEVDINFSNDFSLLLMDLPIRMKDQNGNGDKSMSRRLGLLQKQSQMIKKSYDYMVNYWILSVALSVVPGPFIEIFVKLMRCTTIISVLPGPGKVSFFGGCAGLDVSFWIPHRGNTGVGFSVLTYDGRLQIGTTVDKVLIDDHEEAQRIIDGVFKHIDLFAKEIC